MAHQQEGVGGCLQVNGQDDGAGGFCQSLPGLQNCCCFCEQAGWNKILHTVQHRPETVEDGSGKRWLGESKLVAEGSQPDSRHALQVSNRHMGGVLVQQDLGQPLQQVVQTYNGHVCKSKLSCHSKLLQLVPRQASCGQGCIQHDAVAKQMLLLPSCTSHQLDAGQDQSGQSGGHHSGTHVASQCLVGQDAGDAGRGSSGVRVLQGDSGISSGTEVALPGTTSGLPGVRSVTTVSKEARELLDADVRKSTKKIYNSRFMHFSRYCSDIGVDPTTCSEEIIVNFLAILRREYGYLYQTVSGYRSAISKFHVGFGGAPAGISRNVKRITKAVFLEVPPIPRYADIWPASQLIQYLETLHPPDALSDYQLSAKTLALLSLHSLSRSSTVAQLSPVYQQVGGQLIFSLMGLEKQSRPHHVRGELKIPAGSQDAQPLSSALYCQSYLDRTEVKRTEHAAVRGARPDRFFISNTKVSILIFVG